MSVELQIQIDDMYACLGRCAGCVLSTSERRVTRPDMTEEVMDKALSRVSDYIAELKPSVINITFGIADHFMAGSEYVEKIYRKTAAVLKSNGYGRGNAGIFFTTSMIGKRDEMERKIRYFERVKEDVPLVPVVILDPTNISHPKLAQQWVETSRITKEVFGMVEMAVNLSTIACNAITPQQLMDYASDIGFAYLNVNWTPTVDSVKSGVYDLDVIEKWLLELAHLTSGGETKIRTSLLAHMLPAHAGLRTFDASESLAEHLIKYTPNMHPYSWQISHEGDVFVKFDALGDVPQTPRFGYRKFGSIFESSLGEIARRSEDEVRRDILREYVSDSRCVSCPYVKACSMTGYHIYSHVVGDLGRGRECPHFAKSVWKFLDEHPELDVSSMREQRFY